MTLWHVSEDINKKKPIFISNITLKFISNIILQASLFENYDYVCFIAPVDYCIKWILVDETFCENCSHFILKCFQPYSCGETCFLEESYKKMQKKNEILTILRVPSTQNQGLCLQKERRERGGYWNKKLLKERVSDSFPIMYFKGALDKYNIIPQLFFTPNFFEKKLGIFIPLEVLAWVMIACWVLHSRSKYFSRNMNFLAFSIFQSRLQ